MSRVFGGRARWDAGLVLAIQRTADSAAGALPGMAHSVAS
jgi:hypothetical protein